MLGLIRRATLPKIVPVCPETARSRIGRTALCERPAGHKGEHRGYRQSLCAAPDGTPLYERVVWLDGRAVVTPIDYDPFYDEDLLR